MPRRLGHIALAGTDEHRETRELTLAHSSGTAKQLAHIGTHALLQGPEIRPYCRICSDEVEAVERLLCNAPPTE